MSFSVGHFTVKERVGLLARDTAADFSNFHLLHYRHIDGFMVTAKNSGTHWLKYLISNTLATELNLPRPRYASGRSANDFVGNPKWPHKYPQAPRIGSSHNLPSSFLGIWPIFRALRLPPVVVLVRDIEQAMLSHYVKWREESGLSLSDYVRVRPPGRKGVADIWWYIDFFNRWGQFSARYPDRILVLRYEDLRAEPARWLDVVLRHYRIKVKPSSINAAVAASRREVMRRELDPNAGELIIPEDRDRVSVSFSEEDRALIRALLAKHLKHSFGYHYAAEDWAAERALA